MEGQDLKLYSGVHILYFQIKPFNMNLCCTLNMNEILFKLKVLRIFPVCFIIMLRKVKEAWNSKRDMLVQSGSFAIEQLSEAMAAVATSNKLSDEVPETALRKCADHVRFSVNT